MTSLATYPLVHALGWTLLHFCWQGGVVGLLLYCVLGAMGARSSRLRYAASCAALVLVAILPLITFGHLAIDDYRVDGAAQVSTHAANLVIDARDAYAPLPWQLRIGETLDHAMPWLLTTWSIGASFFLVRLGLGLVAARNLRTSGMAASAELQLLLSGLRKRLGISRAVGLLHSMRIETPAVIGWLRPVVLLPASCLSGLAPEQVEAILCHELAHIRRHDYLVSILQSMVETLFFYHPAVWWISNQIRRERECCCDDFAVSAGVDALAYAQALALLEEQRPRVPHLALAANGGVLKMRIQRLLYRSNGSASQPAFVVLLGLVAFFAVGFATHGVWAEARSAQLSLQPPVTSRGRSANPADQAQLPAAIPQNSPSQASSSAPARGQDEQRISIPLLDYLYDAAKLEKQRLQEAKRGDASLAQSMIPAASAVPAQEPTAPQNSQDARVSAGVMQGMLLTQINPAYPPIAQAAHVQGVVVLRAIISKEGKVEKLQVISGPSMLVQSAIDAVQQWTYRPYLVNGSPVEVQTTINVNYTLGSQPDLSCTYYDLKTVGHDGTCEEGALDKGTYYCRRDDDKTFVQERSGCEWKVKRMETWLHDGLSPAKIETPAP